MRNYLSTVLVLTFFLSIPGFAADPVSSTVDFRDPSDAQVPYQLFRERDAFSLVRDGAVFPCSSRLNQALTLLVAPDFPDLFEFWVNDVGYKRARAQGYIRVRFSDDRRRVVDLVGEFSYPVIQPGFTKSVHGYAFESLLSALPRPRELEIYDLADSLPILVRAQWKPGDRISALAVLGEQLMANAGPIPKEDNIGFGFFESPGEPRGRRHFNRPFDPKLFPVVRVGEGSGTIPWVFGRDLDRVLKMRDPSLEQLPIYLSDAALFSRWPIHPEIADVTIFSEEMFRSIIALRHEYGETNLNLQELLPSGWMREIKTRPIPNALSDEDFKPALVLTGIPAQSHKLQRVQWILDEVAQRRRAESAADSRARNVPSQLTPAERNPCADVIADWGIRFLIWLNNRI